jgi:hypothetical protein
MVSREDAKARRGRAAPQALFADQRCGTGNVDAEGGFAAGAAPLRLRVFA